MPRGNIWEACAVTWGRGYYFLNHCHNCALWFFFLKCHWIQFEHKCYSSLPLCFSPWKLFHTKALPHSRDKKRRWTCWEIAPCRKLNCFSLSVPHLSFSFKKNNKNPFPLPSNLLELVYQLITNSLPLFFLYSFLFQVQQAAKHTVNIKVAGREFPNIKRFI